MNGAFRTDLFFRIAQVRVQLPPLRERRDDILPLVEQMTMQLASQSGAPDAFPRIDRASLVRLAETHAWHGNVRELWNLVSRAVGLEPDGEIDLARHVDDGPRARDNFADRWAPGSSYDDAKRDVLDAFQRDYLSELLDACRGNLTDVARRSGLSRQQVYEIVRRHALRLPLQVVPPVPPKKTRRRSD
jgi:DNA-binding NtrC family response regulator